MYYQSPFDPVYERGDSVALAVQGGITGFPFSRVQHNQDLFQLVREMTNQDITFRLRINSVLEKVEKLRELNYDQV